MEKPWRGTSLSIVFCYFSRLGSLKLRFFLALVKLVVNSIHHVRLRSFDTEEV